MSSSAGEKAVFDLRSWLESRALAGKARVGYAHCYALDAIWRAKNN
jgi:hypothetical protein